MKLRVMVIEIIGLHIERLKLRRPGLSLAAVPA